MNEWMNMIPSCFKISPKRDHWDHILTNFELTVKSLFPLYVFKNTYILASTAFSGSVLLRKDITYLNFFPRQMILVPLGFCLGSYGLVF